jgi:3-oxoacyl-[acyl-carrier-protein] synthase II
LISSNKINFTSKDFAKNTTMKRAVITGLGAVTSLGNNVADYWQGLVNGKNGATAITRFDPINHKTKFACEVKGFDPLLYMEKQDAKRMDLFTQFAIAAADECIKDSGINLETINGNRVGVILASGNGGMLTYEEEVMSYEKNGRVPRFSPFFISKMIPNIASGQISIRYGFRGVSYSIAAACASSNNAIANALDLIRLGRAEIIVAGGTEAPISDASVGGFNAIKALSTLNESPLTASRPFDVNRDGFVMGEGSGVLMIEELEHALNRGANIYCELIGYGAASDAFHLVATHPDGLGATLAMEAAIADAGVSKADISYINAHATSTPIGDISECKAIETVFGDLISKISISASKSMIGHMLGAAGAIEAIACVKSVENDMIHPTINLDNIDPQLNPSFDFTPLKSRKKEVLVALNNTFGFGGHAVTTVFKKFQH